MKNILIKIFTTLFFLLNFSTAGFSSLSTFTHVPLRRTLRTAEEFYSLFRENMYRGTENLNANVFWLEHALKYPFAHPVRALAKIDSPKQWAKYKKLFRFHMYYLITETYLRLGERYEKRNILFFNHKYKKDIETGLKISEIYYNRAKIYWDKVVSLSKILWKDRDNDLYAVDGEVDKWEEMVYKVVYNYKEVNYPKQIKKRLKEVAYKLERLNKGEYKK